MTTMTSLLECKHEGAEVLSVQPKHQLPVKLLRLCAECGAVQRDGVWHAPKAHERIRDAVGRVADELRRVDVADAAVRAKVGAQVFDALLRVIGVAPAAARQGSTSP
jgi:hypothetical protein